MQASTATFRRRAEKRHGLEVEVLEFPEGTETAAAAADAVGCAVSQIASSLVFEVAEEPVVVVTSGANRVSEPRLAAVLDADAEAVTMAAPDRVRKITGWPVGGVPPICHDRELGALFDETLLAHETVYAAAGTPEAMFSIDPERLCTLADADPRRVTEQ